jgi:hypothetical protein
MTDTPLPSETSAPLGLDQDARRAPITWPPTAADVPRSPLAAISVGALIAAVVLVMLQVRARRRARAEAMASYRVQRAAYAAGGHVVRLGQRAARPVAPQTRVVVGLALGVLNMALARRQAAGRGWR